MSQQTASIRRVGFIAPPDWFDISPQEFLRICPEKVAVMQTAMRLPGFGYSLEEFVAAASELRACYKSLVSAGAEVVGQLGYPYSLAHGWKKAQQVQREIRGDGPDLVLMGVEVVHALRHLGCRSVAVASTYYSEKMGGVLREFLTEAGLTVVQTENWQSLGVAEAGSSDMFMGKGNLDPMEWQTPLGPLSEAIRSVAANARAADAILVTGGGMRVLDIADGLEREIEKPIVGGDLALYWGIMRRLGIKKEVTGHGRLLASPG